MLVMLPRCTRGLTNTAVSYKNQPTRGLWCDFSWPLTINTQSKQRFARKVVKSCKVVCRPLMKESIVLGLECSKFWPRQSSLYELARLVCISMHFR